MNLLMVHLWKHPNGTYYIIYSRKKKKSLWTKNKALADRLFRRARQEYLENKVTALGGGPAPKALRDFWEEYEDYRMRTASRFTCLADRQAFRVFLQALGPDTNLSRISRQAVEQALANLAQRVSRTSANTWFRHFKAALSKAVEWGYLLKNPCRGIKPLSVQQAYPRFLTRGEVHRLLQAEPDPEFRLLWQFYILSGCRRSEALSVTVKDVDCGRGRIYLGQTKNRRPRDAFINPEMAAVLWEIMPDVGQLFPWQPDSVTHHFAHTCKQAGVQARLHDLRHTFATWAVMEGIPLRTVQILMGHRDSKTTEIYAHASQEHLETAAHKIRIGEK